MKKAFIWARSHLDALLKVTQILVIAWVAFELHGIKNTVYSGPIDPLGDSYIPRHLKEIGEQLDSIGRILLNK